MSALSARRSVIAIATSLSMITGACAFETDEFAGRLAAAYAADGSRLAYASIVRNGGTITFVDASLDNAFSNTKTRGDIVARHVGKTEQGGFVVGEFVLPQLTEEGDGRLMEVGSRTYLGLTVPGETASPSIFGNTLLFDELLADRAVLERGGVRVEIPYVHVRLDRARADGSLGFQIGIPMSEVDLGALSVRFGADTLTSLNIARVTVAFLADGSWHPQTGALAFDELRLSVRGVGDLHLALRISGYTQEVVRRLNAGEGLEREMSSLMLHSASLSYGDEGFADRLIEHFAARHDMDAAAFRPMVGMLARNALSMMDAPEFKEQLLAVFDAFIAKPGRITISAEPDKAVPLSAMLEALDIGPNALRSLLGISVRNGW